jgi:hypothetical protein
MTGFIVNVFPFRNRVSSKEAFEGLELGEGKPSRPVLRGPGDRKAAWLLGNCPETGLEETNGDLLEADFWPSTPLGAISSLPVIRSESVDGSRLSRSNPRRMG